jgi:putative peptide zinc metalloprotease protein
VRKRLLLFVLALFATLGPAVAPAWAEDDEIGQGPNDNAAVAINLKDGASVFDFAFEVRQTMSDVIDHTNAAVSYSECEDCRTVALAVQVVLVASDPSIVTPENVAVAVNYECTSCETFAAAYQFVIGVDGPVRFTRAGRQELNRIRWELRKLIRQDLPFDELQARIDELMDRLRWVLDNELVPVRGNDDKDDEGHDEQQDGGSSSSEDEGDETVEPTESETTETGTTETGTTETGTTETDTTPTVTTGTTTTTGG